MPLGFDDLSNIVTPFRLTPYSPTGDIGNLYNTRVQERTKKAELEEQARRRQAERDAATEAERGRMQRAQMDSADRAATERRLTTQFQLGREDQDAKELSQIREKLGEALAQGDQVSARVLSELLRRHKSVGRVDEPSLGPATGGAGGGEPKVQEPKAQEPKATVTEGSEGAAASVAMTPEPVDFDADTQTPDWVLPGREKEYQKDPEGEWNLYQGALDEMRAQNPGLSEDELLAKFDERQKSLKKVGDNVAPGQAAPEKATPPKSDLDKLHAELDSRFGNGGPGLSGLGSGGLGGGEPQSAPATEPDLGIEFGRQPRKAADALPEGWQALAGGLTKGPFGTQEETTKAPDGAPGPGEYIAYGKTGEVLFKVSGDEIRQKQMEMVNGSFDALADKEAAARAKQSVLSRIGTAPLKELVQQGMQQYQFDVGQAGKDRRAIVGGNGGFGPADSFKARGDMEDNTRAWMQLVMNQEGYKRFNDVDYTLQRVSSLAGSKNALDQRVAIGELLRAMSGTAQTDRERATYLEGVGLPNAVLDKWNKIFNGGQLNDELMGQLAAQMQGALAQGNRRRSTVAEKAYQTVLQSHLARGADPEFAEKQAQIARGLISGFSVRGGSGKGGASSAPAGKSEPAPTGAPPPDEETDDDFIDRITQ